MTHAGRMRERIVVETSHESNDSRGGVVTTWTVKGVFWAEPNRLGGTELFSGQRLEGVQTVTFRCRDGADEVNDKDRLWYRGQLYDITALEDANDILIHAVRHHA